MAHDANDLVVGLSSRVLETTARLGRPDGIGVYTEQLRTALIREGVQVRPIGSVLGVGQLAMPTKDVVRGFALPLPYLAVAASMTRTSVRLARDVEREIDVYHATDYVVPRLSRKPVVATIYDAIPLAHPEWANPRLRGLKNWLLRDWVRGADAVIAISHAAVDELVEHYRIERSRIHVVPLGVSETWLTPPHGALVDDVLVKHALARGYYLHVGTLQPRKNIDALIDAYLGLPKHIREARQLVIVGKYGWNVEALRRRLLALRPNGRIIWLDYVPLPDLLALYAAAGAFVFPSLAEGFGLPVLEALAVGLPVIASDLAALREVGASRVRYVTPGDIDALCEAMTKLHDTSDCADVVAARRAYAATFGWGRCARETINVYRSVSGLGPTRDATHDVVRNTSESR